ncbi:glutamate racemase [bacterium]|nr:glutamate racemase [bacterium]
MSILNKNLPIAFFDSGIGGLTVYKLFRELLPNEDCIYLGDTANLPYGNKTKEQLIEFTEKIFRFFETQNVKAVIMACNTTSAAVYDTVKGNYPFKIYPLIQTCAKAIGEEKIPKLGIFATQATVNSSVYETEIKKYSPKTRFCSIACPGWVEIVEGGKQVLDRPESVLRVNKYLSEMLEFAPDKIVLGCTHYPYLKNIISDLIRKNNMQIDLIDPAKYFVNNIKTDMEKSDLLNDKNKNGNEIFYASKSPEQFKQNAKLFYEINSSVNLWN